MTPLEHPTKIVAVFIGALLYVAGCGGGEEPGNDDEVGDVGELCDIDQPDSAAVVRPPPRLPNPPYPEDEWRGRWLPNGTTDIRLVPERGTALDPWTLVEVLIDGGELSALIRSDVYMQLNAEPVREISTIDVSYASNDSPIPEAHVVEKAVLPDFIRDNGRYAANGTQALSETAAPTVRATTFVDGARSSDGSTTRYFGIGPSAGVDGWGDAVRMDDRGRAIDRATVVPADMGITVAEPIAIAARPGVQDEVVVASNLNLGGGTVNWVLHRLTPNADGVLERDTWLNGDEAVALQFPGCEEVRARDVNWASNDVISVIGEKTCGGEQRLFFARVNAFGNTHVGMGPSGWVEVWDNVSNTPRAVAVDNDPVTDESYIMSTRESDYGCSIQGGICEVAIARLSPSGVLDESQWGYGLPAVPGWSFPAIVLSSEKQRPIGVRHITATGEILVALTEEVLDGEGESFGTVLGLSDTGAVGPTTQLELNAGDELRAATFDDTGRTSLVTNQPPDEDGSRVLRVDQFDTNLTHDVTTESFPLPGGQANAAFTGTFGRVTVLGSAEDRPATTRWFSEAGRVYLDWFGVSQETGVHRIRWPDPNALPVPYPESVTVAINYTSGPPETITTRLTEELTPMEFPLDSTEHPVGSGMFPRTRISAHHVGNDAHQKSTAQVYALDIRTEFWEFQGEASLQSCETDFCDEGVPQSCGGEWVQKRDEESFPVLVDDDYCPVEAVDESCTGNQREVGWGVPVRAMRSGWVYQCFTQAPENRFFEDPSDAVFESSGGTIAAGGNFVHVLHPDGTISQYGHILSPTEVAAAKPLLGDDFQAVADNADNLLDLCPIRSPIYDANQCCGTAGAPDYLAPKCNGVVLDSSDWEWVEAGEIIGVVGYTGNASSAHIHVHVQDSIADSFLDCGAFDHTSAPAAIADVLDPANNIFFRDYVIGLPMHFTGQVRAFTNPYDAADDWWFLNGELAAPPSSHHRYSP